MAAPVVKPAPSRRKRWKRRTENFLARTMGALFLRLIGKTWKIHIIGLEHRDAATVDGNCPVLSLWHQDIPAGIVAHQGYPIRVMSSRHHDGDVIASIVKRMGHTAIRGSSSAGGAVALRAMLLGAKDPSGYAFTPDGPRGPAYSVAPGVLFLAATVRRPILPIGLQASRYWQAKSWDKMILPKPFATVVLVYVEPLQIARAAMKDDALLEAESLRLREAMGRARELAVQELARHVGPSRGEGK